MFRHVLYFQIIFTLGCSHFAFAYAGGPNHDAYNRSAVKQEIQSMPNKISPNEPTNGKSSDCKQDTNTCRENSAPIQTDDGIQMLT